MTDLVTYLRAFRERAALRRFEREAAGVGFGGRRAHGPLGVAVPHCAKLDEPVWTGPVERRDPDAVRQRSVQLTWFCTCRNWTMHGAYRTGRCNWCQSPRGER